MASKTFKVSPKASLPFRTSNKEKRERLNVRRKKARDNDKRDLRFRRRREEDKDPRLREERVKQNVPLTLERKRVWDNVDNHVGDELGISVDMARMKRQRLEGETTEVISDPDSMDQDEERDSMIESGSDGDADEKAEPESRSKMRTATERATSPTQSIASTNLDLSSEALVARFPALFSSDPHPTPKILITTSLNSTLHHEAQLLTSLFPYSVYIPRSAHHHSHKYSIREIASFASNRHYTALLIMKEDQKKPTGLTIVHLPSGPSFTFSISNWIEGKKLPGHGNPTDHIPELILNNFRTPLGSLTAHMLRQVFPPQPDFQGRQVVTLHNQRDYIFVRRHRYVFREKKASEKSVVGIDGKEFEDVKGIKAGLQELGPRFTMKLRRIDKGIQRRSGQEWEWKGGMEKVRTRFQL